MPHSGHRNEVKNVGQPASFLTDQIDQKSIVNTEAGQRQTVKDWLTRRVNTPVSEVINEKMENQFSYGLS